MSSLLDLQPWQKAFRDGIAPELGTAELVALQLALAADDPRLLQGETTSPPALQAYSCHPPDGCCALAYAGCRGLGLPDIGRVEERFAEICARASNRLGWDGAGVSVFLNWWDETPRSEAVRLLLADVNAVLDARLGLAVAA